MGARRPPLCCLTSGRTGGGLGRCGQAHARGRSPPGRPARTRGRPAGRRLLPAHDRHQAGATGHGGHGGPTGDTTGDTASTPAGSSGTTTTTTDATTDQTASDPTAVADPATLGGPDDLIGAPPVATVIVRVDLAALRRGSALPGELCELDGHGPVPVDVARSLVDAAFLACVFTEAGDIRAVAHAGRTINAHLRTALALRDRHCVVPGCGVAYSLEIDHVHPLEHGGRTELDNLALRCRHHHRMKTYDGWTLERTGPTDEDPGWAFTPQPPFGREPDLGLDIGKDLSEPVPRE